jgi:hypothetical protein
MPVTDDRAELTLLRAIRGDIADLRRDVRELKVRIDVLEQGYASLSRRIDHTGDDIAVIRRRLDAVDA